MKHALAIAHAVMTMIGTTAVGGEVYGPDLLVNGDFAAGAWRSGLYDGAKGKVELVGAGVPPGKLRAMSLRQETPAQGLLQADSILFPMPADGLAHKLRVNCQYRGAGNLQIRFWRLDAGKLSFLRNGVGQGVWLDKAMPPTGDWRRFEAVWEIPGEVSRPGTSVSVAMQLYAPDTELQVAEVSARVAAPAAMASGDEVIFAPPAPIPAGERAWWAPRPAPYPWAIDGRLFVKEGEATYLVGSIGYEWGVDALWLRRLLGYDYHSVGWSSDRFGVKEGKAPDGKRRLEVSFQSSMPLYSYFSEVVRNRQLPQLINNACPEFSPLRPWLERFPSLREFFLAEGCHSLSYDFHSKRGRELYRWTFEDKLEYLERLPLLAYEIYREPGYSPSTPRVRAGFRAYVQRKYCDLEVANQAWRSGFKSWDEVEAPHLKGAALLISWSDKIAKINDVYKNQPEMYNDWLEYLRQDFYTGTLALKAIFKQLSDKPFNYDCRTQRHYFDGYAAIDPELVADVVDIFFCHTNYSFFEYGGQPADQPSLLRGLMDAALYHDYLGDNTDKPIINTEDIVGTVNVSGGSARAMADHCLGKFHGDKAKFKLVRTEKELEPVWTSPGFDDSAWGTIRVPGPWDETPAHKGEIGWGVYRFHFKIPGGLVQQNFKDGTCRYLLYGQGVAQRGAFWLNGQKIGEVKGWDSKYQFDVSGLLNYGGDNTLAVVVDGSEFYAEGLRRSLYLLANNMLDEARPAEEKHYASILWSNLVHGCSGNTFWHWDNEVHGEMPRLKAAIESAAPIILPRSGPTGSIAMLYPYESFRGMLNNGHGEYLDYMSYFGAATFSHVPTDILSCRKLAAMRDGRYPLLILPYAHLVRQGCFERVEKFAAAGGTVLITFDSLIQDDGLYQKLPVERLAGIKVLGDVTEKRPALDFQGENYSLEVGDMVGKAGVKIAAQGAEVLGTYTDGSPAITVKQHGKGKICYVAARLDMVAAQALLGKLLADARIAAPLDVASANPVEPPYVEVKVIGTPERFVLYALNWGGQAHDLTLKLADADYLKADYLARDIVATANGDKAETAYSAATLRDGFHLTAKPQTPVAWLFERAGSPRLALKSVPPAKKKLLGDLEALFANPEKPGGKPKALLVRKTGENGTTPEFSPVVVQALRDEGLEPWFLKPEELTPEKLREFAVVFLAETQGFEAQLGADFPKRLVDYLNDGGSLLLLFSSNGVMHNSSRSVWMTKLITPAFKVNQGDWCENPKHCGYGDPLQINTKQTGRHPVAGNVKELQFFVASTLTTTNPAFTPVALSMPDDLRQPSKPLAMAGEVGEGGRIFIAGDTLWAQPERVEEADNLQLLVNAVDWLAKKPIRKIDKAERVDKLIVSKKRLEESEKD